MCPGYRRSLIAKSHLNGSVVSPRMPLNVQETLEQLELSEKVALTAGVDMWHTVPVPRLEIPSVRTSDGPNGIRGTQFFNSEPAACLPASLGLGATWDQDLLYQVGELLAAESRAKSAHVVLAPTINIQRSPLGGRSFESFSEDPLLSGKLATQYVRGLQDNKVAACIKHFVTNDQENGRMGSNSVVTDRALREIYLKPFEIAVREANPKAFMTAYNKLNGTHVSENEILATVLRGEWKWRGLVMSDWFGTYSTSDAVNAGLDLEMPGPPRWRGQQLTHALLSNKVTTETLDERVSNVLEIVKYSQESGIPFNGPESTNNTPKTRQLLRKLVSDSTVLLRNDADILPLDKTKKVAMIGPNAKATAFCGGGSASLRPYYTVSPFEGVTSKTGSEPDYAVGAYAHKELPDFAHYLTSESGEKGIWDVRFYNDKRGSEGRKCFDELTIEQTKLFLFDYSHKDIPDDHVFYVDATASLRVPQDGVYDFGITLLGTAKLYIDDKRVLDCTKDQENGDSFFGEGTKEKIGSIELKANTDYAVRLEFGSEATSPRERGGLVSNGGGAVQAGMARQAAPEETIAEAVELAKSAEQLILFSGLNMAWESEGYDRPNMSLPPHNDALIEAVLDVNPDAVIVIQSGAPVEMPWAHKAKTIVHATFGGNETGNGIADVLFGDVNPSGKLPITYPLKVQHTPSYYNFGHPKRTLYGEDVFVGYRHYEKVDRDVLFPFGHGLSYTSFELTKLDVSKKDNEIVTVTVDVKNTGSKMGAETVQVYVSQDTPSIVRPVKELRGFSKVELDAGKTKTVSVELDVDQATSFWNEYISKWTSEAGKYHVHVGTSSAGKHLSGEFAVDKTKNWVGL